MSKTERRKLYCSVFFHVVAITCVIWSLYVLIEKTALELQNGMLSVSMINVKFSRLECE